MPAASLDVGPAGRIGVAWTSGHADELRDVYFAESVDRGASYGANHRVTATSEGIQELPDLCYDSQGTVHLLWNDARAPEWDYDILHAASYDGGQTFEAPERVNDDPAEETHGQEEVAVARMPSGGAAAIWLDGREVGGENVYFAGPARMGIDRRPGDRSADGGCDRGRRLRVHPSPCRGRVWLSGAAAVWDAAGRRVAEIPAPGRGAWVTWDGRDANGRVLAGGNYWLGPPDRQHEARHILILR